MVGLRIKKIINYYHRHFFLMASCVVALMGFFIFFSLMMYTKNNCSWFFFTSQSQGSTYSYVSTTAAALLFYYLGYAAWLSVPLFLYGSLFFIKPSMFYKEWDRFMALGCGIVLVAILNYTQTFQRAFLAKFILDAFHIKDYFLVRIVSVLLLIAAFIVLTRLSWARCVSCIHYMVMIHAKMCRMAQPYIRALRYGCRMVYTCMCRCCRWLISLVDGSVIQAERGGDVEWQHDAQQLQEIWQFYENTSSEPLLSEHPLEHKAIEQPVKPVPSAVPDDILAAQKVAPYALPSTNIFSAGKEPKDDKKIVHGLEAQARILEEKLARFGVVGNVVSMHIGPVVTLFEYQPQIDSKISKIIALEDDLAMALETTSIRIIAPIPGKSVVGFEVANKVSRSVLFSSIVRSPEFLQPIQLPLILGEDTIGKQVVVDLIKMPHLLVGGSTGSGKSVALNAMLISLLCKRSPDELKLVLIDPKRLEFAAYHDIAHLLFPIVTLPAQAATVLKWLVSTMEKRYEQMATVGVKNIMDFHQKFSIQEMPFIVVVIDELADLMMTAGKEVESLIARLAQMARAAGIHLIVATQRPSVDVVTGLIKVNFPSRIAFRVVSKVDSRTILDCIGAEKLLGRGDMLFLDVQHSCVRRVHGAYVSAQEINAVVNHIKSQRDVQYVELVVPPTLDNDDEQDGLYDQVITFLQEIDEVSISLLQRKFRIGYNRSARIIEKLEVQGRIISIDGGRMRKVVKQNAFK